MRKVGEPMEPGWTLHVHSSKGELACIAALSVRFGTATYTTLAESRNAG